MDASRTFTAAAVHQEEDWYIAQCLEVDVASQGRTIQEALDNLAEAVELYLDEVADPQQYITSTPLVTSLHVTGQLPAYSAAVSREDDLWVAVVEELPAGATDAETIEDLHGNVRDLIASLRDIDPDSFLIDWRYLPEELEPS